MGCRGPFNPFTRCGPSALKKLDVAQVIPAGPLLSSFSFLVLEKKNFPFFSNVGHFSLVPVTSPFQIINYFNFFNKEEVKLVAYRNLIHLMLLTSLDIATLSVQNLYQNKSYI